MGNSRFILHAPNVHCGGGLILLKTLLEVLPDHASLIVDERLHVSEDVLERFQVQRIRPTMWHRLGAERLLSRMVKQGDDVLCFGNLPPLFKLKGKAMLFLQNRYLIDMVSLSNFPLKVRLRIMMERFWLRLFRGHIDQVIVQSWSMSNLLKAHFSMSADVLPFVARVNDSPCHGNLGEHDEKLYDFVYVASGEPHKNHCNLIKAWVILAEKSIHPSLCLTLNVDQFPDLISWIEQEKSEHSLNVVNVGSLPGREVMNLYTKAKALVFPSTLESFGLPLIEAKSAGLPIVAAELDYVRDVIVPNESFDPNSPVSIARAVKRMLGEEEGRLEPLDARSFLQKII